MDQSPTSHPAPIDLEEESEMTASSPNNSCPEESTTNYSPTYPSPPTTPPSADEAMVETFPNNSCTEESTKYYPTFPSTSTTPTSADEAMVDQPIATATLPPKETLKDLTVLVQPIIQSTIQKMYKLPIAERMETSTQIMDKFISEAHNNVTFQSKLQAFQGRAFAKKDEDCAGLDPHSEFMTCMHSWDQACDDIRNNNTSRHGQMYQICCNVLSAQGQDVRPRLDMKKTQQLVNCACKGLLAAATLATMPYVTDRIGQAYEEVLAYEAMFMQNLLESKKFTLESQKEETVNEIEAIQGTIAYWLTQEDSQPFVATLQTHLKKHKSDLAKLNQEIENLSHV